MANLQEMSDSEWYVRERVENIGVYGYGGTTRYVYLADMRKEFCGKDEAEAWSTARAWVEQREEEIRKIEEEIEVLAYVKGSFDWEVDDHKNDDAALVRILARLEAIRDELQRGMKQQKEV